MYFEQKEDFPFFFHFTQNGITQSRIQEGEKNSCKQIPFREAASSLKFTSPYLQA
jgi:hypothetical protein